MIKVMKNNYKIKKFDKEWNKILDKDKFITLKEL